MQLEDYFNFLDPDDIRLKGSRIGIETILYDFLCRSRTPEEIHCAYPSLTREQVYATITYYYHKQAEIDDYIRRWWEHGERMRKEQEANPDPTMLRLRRLRAERDAQRQTVAPSS